MSNASKRKEFEDLLCRRGCSGARLDEVIGQALINLINPQCNSRMEFVEN
jgi:hypothetical protein